MIDNSFYELSSFYDIVTQHTNHSLTDIKMSDLMKWLKNPVQSRKRLIKLSRYYYSKDGVITDVYDLLKTLPILNYSIHWDNIDKIGYQKNKNKIDEFISNIKLKKLVRDTLFTVAQDGFCVWYNRKNKYIQFLEDDQIEIKYMVNGKWQVLFDLSTLDSFAVSTGLLEEINSAPDEVTVAIYNEYKKGKRSNLLPLDINKTQVFKLRGSRNVPYGIPYAIPALASIMHKDLLEKTEKALADRIINQIVVQKIGTMPSPDGNSQLPVPRTSIDGYHNNLKQLLQKKYDINSSENMSTAPLTVPSFVSIEELKINMTTFPKEVWERIDSDIYKKLGYSTALNSGGGSGQSYGSATINAEKIFSVIFFLIEDIEEAVNEYMKIIVSNFNPKLKFSRETILDKKTRFDQAKDLYLEARGSLKDLVEASGRDFDHWLAQVKYENEVLRLDEILPVHQTSYTQSSNPGGAPVQNSPSDGAMKTRGNNSNSMPTSS